MGTIEKRLELAISNSGKSITSLADSLNINEKTLRNYKKDGKKIPTGNLISIARACHVSETWLLSGEGSMLKKENTTINVSGDGNNTNTGSSNTFTDSFNQGVSVKKKTYKENESDLIDIPYFEDINAAAGHGAINYSEVSTPVSFDRTFLKKQFGITAVKNVHIINSIGNSMEPTLKEGELLLINPFENESMQIKDGGIYVITTPNGTLVKRVSFNPIDGSMTLTSDNKNYKDIEITQQQFDGCRIIGRVVGHFDKI